MPSGKCLVADRSSLDLTDQRAVFDFFAEHRPTVQIICAATVGGIAANNSYPGAFIGQNLMMQANLLEAARRFSCRRTVFVSSGCVYPRHAGEGGRKIIEEDLLTGLPESTNQWYSVAKCAGMKMAQAYRQQYGLDMWSVLPCNIYGHGDSFHLENAHVLPALMRKFHEAKESSCAQVAVWGNGESRRQFIHVDDVADAIIFLLSQEYVPDWLNIAHGGDIAISELAEIMKTVVGFSGEIVYDRSRPDGVFRKILNDEKMRALGWCPSRSLEQGLRDTYTWFLHNLSTIREVEIIT